MSLFLLFFGFVDLALQVMQGLSRREVLSWQIKADNGAWTVRCVLCDKAYSSQVALQNAKDSLARHLGRAHARHSEIADDLRRLAIPCGKRDGPGARTEDAISYRVRVLETMLRDIDLRLKQQLDLLNRIVEHLRQPAATV